MASNPPASIQRSLRVRLRSWGVARPGLYYAGPLVAWAAVVLVLSLAPSPERLPPISLPNADKAGHFLMYVLLGWLAVRAAARDRRPRPAALVSGPLAAGLYGFAMEGLQALTSWRTFDPLDALANLAGAILGATIYWVWAKGLAKAPAGVEDVTATASNRHPT